MLYTSDNFARIIPTVHPACLQVILQSNQMRAQHGYAPLKSPCYFGSSVNEAPLQSFSQMMGNMSASGSFSAIFLTA